MPRVNNRIMSDRISAPIIVVGAGIGGLVATLRLSHAGHSVTVIDRAETVGGKMRTLPSAAGPVDAGPTVLTMRHVFDGLFDQIGERLEDHVTLVRQHVLARHWWPDGSTLDLCDDESRNAAAIKHFAGAKAAREFARFSARARRLFAALDAPMMQAADPSIRALATTVLRQPMLLRDMAPGQSLRQTLARNFGDPRLRQLFGRYATYVGGVPNRSPALLQLIWEAEARGVWCVQGGMHQLAMALHDLAIARGAEFLLGCHVARIERDSAVHLADGTRLPARMILFNGDPRALATGQLGPDVDQIASQTRRAKRSLSAHVWSFAGTPHGPDLAHHNVFFTQDPREEFGPLEQGQTPQDASLYICAQDRGFDTPPPTLERFEIIRNAPPLGTDNKAAPCPPILPILHRFGLTFSPEPTDTDMTGPAQFETLFPASMGALYGQTPHGMTAALDRPRARTAMPGLYLCGGGTHPGAGVPMAALSGRHAAEAMLSDLGSTSTSPRTATPGGMSMASATAAPAPSRSSDS